MEYIYIYNNFPYANEIIKKQKNLSIFLLSL